MRLLLSLAGKGHELCLAGYDWDKQEIFWTLENDYFTGISICYDGEALLGAAGDAVTRISGDPSLNAEVQLHGPHDIGAHNVHIIDDETYGVVETGNSRVTLIDKQSFKIKDYLCPVELWGNPILPWDPLHLNDFASTPYGILATAFNHQPWRSLRENIGTEQWFRLNHGLIFNLTGSQKAGARIVGCGLSHPHTLMYIDPYIYVISSAQGIFHQFRMHLNSGSLIESDRIHIANEHWVRGATQIDNVWYIGGIESEYHQDKQKRVKRGQLSIFRVTNFSRIEERKLDLVGEVYDVLPWKDEVMNPLIKVFAQKGNVSKY